MSRQINNNSNTAYDLTPPYLDTLASVIPATGVAVPTSTAKSAPVASAPNPADTPPSTTDDNTLSSPAAPRHTFQVEDWELTDAEINAFLANED